MSDICKCITTPGELVDPRQEVRSLQGGHVHSLLPQLRFWAGKEREADPDEVGRRGAQPARGLHKSAALTAVTT